MPAGIETKLDIPDLWYDFFSRFLPGTLFIFGVRVFLADIAYYKLPSITEAMILLGAGYIVGLTMQPMSSLLIMRIQNQAATIQGYPENYVQEIIDKLGVKTYSAKILLKMHGEVAYFSQLAVLSTFLILLLLLLRNTCWIILLPIPPVSLSFALMVGHRRVRRAALDDQLFRKKSKSKTAGTGTSTSKRSNLSTGKPMNA